MSGTPVSFSSNIPRNDENDLQAIGDDYKKSLQYYEENWLAYALQKDAIQNSWDARLDRHGNGWEFSMSIMDGGGSEYVVINDTGTSGLTGHTWSSDEEHRDLIKSEDPEENLAFFLSSNFSGKKSGKGGKRGRGKFLFLVASEDSVIYFESLRQDGERIYGSLYIKKDKGLAYALMDRAKYIDWLGNDVKPLTKTGTRIFIKNPSTALSSAIRTGLIKDYIEKTWWEIIKKYQAKFVVRGKDSSEEAKLSEWYADKQANGKEGSSTRREFSDIKFTAGEDTYRVKRIVFDYVSDGDIPGDIKGLAIQRQGMAIERLSIEKLMKEEGAQKVYGWLEMDKTLEEAMYDLEDVQHLGFTWTAHPAKKLREVISSQLREYARQVKLLESDLTQQHSVTKEIEKEVSDKINKYLSSFGFQGGGTGRTKSTANRKKRSDNTPLRISLASFKVPSSRRVEYDETIRAEATFLNELPESIRIKAIAWIVQGSETILLKEEELTLSSGGIHLVGWPALKVTKDKFSRAEYSFRAKLVVLEDTDMKIKEIGKIEKGLEQRVATAFSVDQDHKPAGFIKFEPKDRDDKSRYFECVMQDRTIVVQYNSSHPYIVKLMPASSKDKEKYAQFEKFLLETGIVLALNQVLAEDIASDKPTLFKNLDDDMALSEAIPMVLEEVSHFMWGQ